MIIETIRKEITNSGKSRYQIARESGVSESQLCKVMAGKSLFCETADVLLKYFKLKIIKSEK